MNSSSLTLSRRNAGIDILRGFSILLVVSHHISIRIPLSKTGFAYIFPHQIIELFAYDGSDAVVMFFVISGFLISRRSIEQSGTLGGVSPSAFYRHRASRILPLLGLLLSALILFNWLGWKNFQFVHENQSLTGATLAVLTCTFNWYEGMTNHWAPANWDVLWSLSIEEVFYLAFPLLCFLPAWPRVFLLLVLVILGPIDHGLISSASEIWKEKAYLPGFGAIATGVLATLVSRRFSFSSRVAYAFVLGGLLLSALELMTGNVLWKTTGEWMTCFLTFGTALTLVGFDALEKAGRSTAPRWGLGWLRRMGPLSYEIYLSHMFLVLPAVQIFAWSGADIGRTGFLVYMLVIPACAVLGAGIARSISRPLTRWFDRRGQRKFLRA